jgi:hypothetical protein
MTFNFVYSSFSRRFQRLPDSFGIFLLSLLPNHLIIFIITATLTRIAIKKSLRIAQDLFVVERHQFGNHSIGSALALKQSPALRDSVYLCTIFPSRKSVSPVYEIFPNQIPLILRIAKSRDNVFVVSNAPGSICRSNESDSKETDESGIQPKKQEELRISTVSGMTMDTREERENAFD